MEFLEIQQQINFLVNLYFQYQDIKIVAIMEPGEADNSRLEPLVRAAVNLQRSGRLKSDPSPPVEIKVEKSEAGCSFSFKDYEAAVKKDIHDNYSIPGETANAMVDALKAEKLGDYPDKDYARAIELANGILVEGLYIESSHGDCPEAVKELQSRFPGISKNLCSDIIGWYGYINR